ncbi:hypothetical protein [Humisphaera borealis]|uniref:Uncharacterized protein n=1 Tax=Humisphaera borealis TaxID=2807512 RepID=A0A7M2WQS9_9BACT|nr:hypothetical protein [Humisphaera borealis]QOV87905.1 hypothetical protein IPV69_16650 [Humisphaera borealis]
MFATCRSTRDMRSSEGVLRYRDERGVMASGLKVQAAGTSIDSGFAATYFSADRISAARDSERKFNEIKTMWSDRA